VSPRTNTHRAPGATLTPLGRIPSGRTVAATALAAGTLAVGLPTATADSVTTDSSPVLEAGPAPVEAAPAVVATLPVAALPAAPEATEALTALATTSFTEIDVKLPVVEDEKSTSDEDASDDDAEASEPATRGSAGSSSIMKYAERAIGTDYSHAGESLSGMDCSGLVDWVYKQAGIDLNGNRTANQMMRGGQRISMSEVQPGDLVGYKTGGSKYTHIAIYAGNGRVIDASNNRDTVVERDMWGKPTWHAVTYR
jgi:peptidoglycan DL-endopeptidase CwlO